MTVVNLIFPHQLFEKCELLRNDQPIYLIEEWLFFHQYSFHKQKLAFHRASMRCYQDYLKGQGKKVTYIDATTELCDIRSLISHLSKKGITEIQLTDPTDDWLSKRLTQACSSSSIKL